MKKTTLLLVSCFISCLLNVNAQTFEGVVKWKMQMDISGGKSQPQISSEDAAKASQGMNDAQKAMMEKMNDPEFKKQMEQNPQVKAMMEQQMKKMEGYKTANNGSAAGAQGMLPTGMTMKIKGGDRIVQMEGGMFAGEILYLKDKDLSYKVDRNNKTYSALPKGKDNEKGTDAKVTKTDEFITILGYKCRKFIAESGEGKKITTNFWATTEFKEFDRSVIEKLRAGRNNMQLPAGVEGMPLKIEVNTDGNKITMEVTEIKKQPLDASEFSISGLTETKGFGGY